ncbi:MAG TPA: helical backbone metal receptor [Phycisphaerae bacterium]|nr:ABC transporter substrate-binding protein [Phycisphaerales bacterium]HRX85815.1 helical backbone metal receptor [Phycisphaerae bacterium]
MISLLLTLIFSLNAGATPPEHGGEPPQRIIANAPSNAEIVCALGACDRLVGVSAYVTYPDQTRELPKVGGLDDPDLEKILALRPDLVIQRGHNAHVAGLCERHGIAMYEDRTDSLATLYTTIRDLGGLLGEADKARALTDSIRGQLDDIAAGAAQHRPRVLLALRSRDRLTPLTTVGKPSYLHEVIEIAGGTNVFGDVDVAYPEVGLEEVIARQPDIIIEAMPGATLTPEEIENIVKQWDAVPAVPAIRNKAIHVLTADYVLTPSPRVVLLAKKLHELFTDEATARAD